MTTREKILSNIEVHGIIWTGNWCKKQKIPFDTFYFVLFGRYPVSKKV